jgi:hypothetical protein
VKIQKYPFIFFLQSYNFSPIILGEPKDAKDGKIIALEKKIEELQKKD